MVIAGENIFLVGPMGSGKTTVGRQLANASAREFVDSDREIEARTGVDIPYIFEREGEEGFRRRERKIIQELSARRGIVLATGGGAVLDPGNRRVLAARGLVVYLRASVRAQFERTSHSRHRPLLAEGDRRQTLQRLWEEREPLYREIADLVVHVHRQSARAVAVEILRDIAQLEVDERSLPCPVKS
ncbi:MAG TPA: shikimate kinase AroK [Nevskiaceae bacterium]